MDKISKKDIMDVEEIIEKIEIENQRKREEKEGEIIEIEEIIYRNNRRIGEIMDKIEKIAMEEGEKSEKIEKEINKALIIEERIKNLEEELKDLKTKKDVILQETFNELKRMI